MSEEKISDKVQKLAYQNEKIYHGYVQSLLAVVQDMFRMEDKNVFNSGSRLAGGKRWKRYYRNIFKLAVGMRWEFHLQNRG